MGVIDDASGKREIQKLWDAVRRNGTISPLDNSSVEGRTRFIGNESLLVEGSQKVTGWLIVTGTLKVVGTFLLDGITTITGALTSSGTALFTGAFTSRGTTRFEGDTTQVGASHVQGNQDITGTLAVKGAATLESNLTVNSPGKVILGTGLQLEPMGAGGGAITFLPTGSIAAGLGKITMVAPDLTAIVTIGASALNVSGSITSTVDVIASGRLYTVGAPTTTQPANVYVSSSGGLQKVSSARRFKIDPQLMVLPDSLLGVPVKSWIDLGDAERFAALFDAPRPLTAEQQSDFDAVDLTRVPGVIAEEVEAAGGESFVTRDADGVIAGVAYDRLALARTEILARKLDAAMELISELQRKLAA